MRATASSPSAPPRTLRDSPGPNTRRLTLSNRFITPGFIDNHTHFGQAGALLLGVNLLDVADEKSLAAQGARGA